jgi:hypothetical protein
MTPLPPPEARAFRNSFLAAAALLAASTAGALWESAPARPSCPVAARSEQAAQARLLDRVTPDAALARAGQRIALAVLQRALAGPCD